MESETFERSRPRRRLTYLAWMVAAELNMVESDDERELLQEHFERLLNDELFTGSLNRAALAETTKRLRGDSLLAATLRLVNPDGSLS